MAAISQPPPAPHLRACVAKISFWCEFPMPPLKGGMWVA